MPTFLELSGTTHPIVENKSTPHMIGKSLILLLSGKVDNIYANEGVGYELASSRAYFKDEYESTVDIMGDNYWKYGIEAKRKELEAIMRYVFEQGLVKRQITYEELFDASTLDLYE